MWKKTKTKGGGSSASCASGVMMIPLLLLLLTSSTSSDNILETIRRASSRLINSGQHVSAATTNSSGVSVAADSINERLSPPRQIHGDDKERIQSEDTAASSTQVSSSSLSSSARGLQSSFTCPPLDSSSLSSTLELSISSVESASFTIGIANNSPGYLCTLTRHDISNNNSIVPIARSYEGNNWEVSAGSYAEILSQPSCGAPDAVEGACLFESLPPQGADIDAYVYVLTSYQHAVAGGKKAEAARFLEQATFGRTKADIDSLYSTTATNSGEPDYLSWLTDQIMTTPMTSHRAYYRSHTNARFEYSNLGAGPGPETACHYSSQWRTFALSERDGIRSSQSACSKYLSIKELNGKFVWYVEGMARTVTDYRPALVNSLGEFQSDFRVEPTYYQIHFSDNEKWNCVGCLIRVVERRGGGSSSGYVANPKVDLTGIENNSNLVPYTVIDLPPILTSNDDRMVSIDNGDNLGSYFLNFYKPNDEFYLNTSNLDKGQCADHPPVRGAAYAEDSRLDHSKNSDVDENNHPETAFPPIFGRTLNGRTGQSEILLFDPHIALGENTIENPLPDGGGRMVNESDGEQFCSNAPQTFQNEEHCKFIFI